MAQLADFVVPERSAELTPWEPIRGAVINGRYVLREERGSGGMGTVWEAEHQVLKRSVAVKFLNVASTDLSSLHDRFVREARAAAAVRHRNVVDIIDFGTLPNGQPYMVMELLEGRSLSELLDACDPISVANVVEIGTGLLAGLEAVHEAGLLHSDIKPDNVFLVREGDAEIPKLLDFGVSRAQHGRADGRESVVPTIEGMVLGTPAYMSPEQARGEKCLDGRADVYSTGVLLYELFARRLPFDAASPAEVIAQVLRDQAVPLERYRPDLPAGVVAVVAQAMERDREKRFATAKLMGAALSRALVAANEEWTALGHRVGTGVSEDDQDAPSSPGAGPRLAAHDMPTLDATTLDVRVTSVPNHTAWTRGRAATLVAVLCAGALSAVLASTNAERASATAQADLVRAPAATAPAVDERPSAAAADPVAVVALDLPAVAAAREPVAASPTSLSEGRVRAAAPASGPVGEVSLASSPVHPVVARSAAPTSPRQPRGHASRLIRDPDF